MQIDALAILRILDQFKTKYKFAQFQINWFKNKPLKVLIMYTRKFQTLRNTLRKRRNYSSLKFIFEQAQLESDEILKSSI